MKAINDFTRYARKGLLLDTNIALLLVVGSYDPAMLPNFKRTVQFAPEDYSTLLRVMSRFKTVVTTPAILAEVNSLASQFGAPAKTDVLRALAKIVKQLSEYYIPSTTIADDAAFPRFGLTDTNIKLVAAGRFLVLRRLPSFRLLRREEDRSGELQPHSRRRLAVDVGPACGTMRRSALHARQLN
jgi:hypothetical protein